MTKPSDTIDKYLLAHSLNSHSGRWSGGPGQVVLNAPESDREQFRRLRSADISNPIDAELAAFQAMSGADLQAFKQRQENKRLLKRFDAELAKHKKLEI
ncbi:MAG: hypothetical protein WC919_05490 [Candidatus Paceibacterota bacterium]|jgi:hypothetical protein